MDTLDVLDIGIQLIKAIEILHENGFTHNDLKLENIMIKGSGKSGSENNVVVIDYGYAKRY
jgi:serine/threonine protein kinase